MHYFIEHNRGHHKRVATPHDSASAPKGQVLYFYWIRCFWGEWYSAWLLEKNRMNRLGKATLSLGNEMVQFIFIQLVFIALAFFLFRLNGGLFLILVAGIGIIMLETVNYIEHYGLQRKEISPGIYESVQPWHSWNSDHPIGRIMLFELTRHSDHHYRASRKYQILRHMEKSPQLPTGYPGMMLLSMVPPLWFKVIDKRIPAA